MPDQPDVLMVLSDQQRPDTIGAYGQLLPTTPVLDGLAQRGTTFDRAFTVAPVCGPARASIQSGRYPTDVGCWRNGLSLPSGMQTMATRMAALGYATGYVGKWHLASDRGPGLPPSRSTTRYEKRAVPRSRRGGYADAWVAADALELTSGATSGHVWDENDRRIELEGYRVDGLTDLALDRLTRLAGGDRPFLLFVSYLEPHHQNDRLRTIGPRGWARRFRDFEVPGDLRGTLGDWRWNYAQSLAACSSIDANVGRLLDALDSSGRDRGALVIYSSDHGSHFRTRNVEYKRSCHDASIRVPLIIAGPGFGTGTRDDRLVTHLDVLPTLLASAGGAGAGFVGMPLQVSPILAAADAHSGADRAHRHGHDHLDAGEPPWRDDVLVQISESQIGRALRTATHTFSAAAPGANPWRGHLRSSSPTYVETHLYDLAADPHQRHNLAGDPEHTALRNELAERLESAVYRVEGHMPRVLLRS